MSAGALLASLVLSSISCFADDEPPAYHDMSTMGVQEAPPQKSFRALSVAPPAQTPPGQTPPGQRPPDQTQAPAEDRNRPVPWEELEKKRQQLVADHPISAKVINDMLSREKVEEGERRSGTLITPKDVQQVERYIRARDGAVSILKKYDPKIDEGGSKSGGLLSGLFGKLLGKGRVFRDGAKVQRYQDEMERSMQSLHPGPLGQTLMTGDPLAHRLMPNPKRADEDYIQSRPRDPEPFMNIGRRMLEDGDAKGAAEHTAQAAALAPNDAGAAALNAAALREMGEVAAAAAEAARALQLDPNNKMAQGVYAMSAGRGGGSPSANSGSGFSAQPASFAPQAAPALSAAEIAKAAAAQASAAVGSGGREAAGRFAVGDYVSASRAAAAAAAKNPKDLLAQFYLSASRLRMGDASGALEAAEAGLAADPRNAALLLAKAQALNKLGRYRDALAAARTASEINPRDANALVASAEALAGLGDRAGAIAALRGAAALDSRFQALADEAATMASDGDLLSLFQGGASKPGAPAAPAGAKSGLSKNLPLALGAGAAGLVIAVVLSLLLKKRDA